MKTWTKEELEGKKPGEIAALIMEAHQAHAKNLEDYVPKKELEAQATKFQENHDELKEALSTLEAASKEAQENAKAEIISLKRGKGWREEEKREKDEFALKCFDTYIRKGEEHLTAKEAEDFEKAVREKDMIAGSSELGGFLVLPEIGTQILNLVIEMSSLRGMARVISGSSKSFEEPHQTDVSEAFYIGEQNTRPKTKTPTVGNFKVEAKTMYAAPEISNELLADADYDVLAFLMGDVSRQMNKREGLAHFRGVTPLEPSGILTRDATGSLSAIPQITGGSSLIITYDDLVKLSVKPKKPYRRDSRWLATKETIGDLRLVKDLEDRPLIFPDIARAGLPTLLGAPVEETFDMDENKVAGKFPLSYGDHRQLYTIYDRSGMSVIRDNISRRGFTAFVHEFRSGGEVRVGEAIVLHKTKA